MGHNIAYIQNIGWYYNDAHTSNMGRKDSYMQSSGTI